MIIQVLANGAAVVAAPFLARTSSPEVLISVLRLSWRWGSLAAE